MPEALRLQFFLFLLKLFSTNILKMKTQAIGISHTGTDSCCLWVEERYGYALSIVHPLRCREMRIVLKFAGRHLIPNQNDILKQLTVLVWGQS